MILADIKGHALGEFRNQGDAVNHLINRTMVGVFQVGGLDWEGRYRQAFVEVSDAGNGAAIVYLTDRPGHRWHYVTTPWPSGRPVGRKPIANS